MFRFPVCTEENIRFQAFPGRGARFMFPLSQHKFGTSPTVSCIDQL